MARPAVVLLHGMFGSPDNWRACAERLRPNREVLVPELPVWDLPRSESGVAGLVSHLERFLEQERVGRAAFAGNSLGGHVALELALRRPERAAALVLTGSSGLFERGLASPPPRRPTRDWIRTKVREVFYHESHVTEALVDQIHKTVLDVRRVKKIVCMAKSAKRGNLSGMLHRIGCPVLLAWGREDLITPPEAALDFKRHIPHAELAFIGQCGHAPNIEQPQELSALMESFLDRHCPASAAS